jgi:UDP-N-acetylglucosamine 2-epimerase
MGYAEKTVAISGNTVVDAVRYAKGQAIPNQLPQKNYVLTTIHRVETIYSHQRLEMIVDLLQRISKTKKVIFVLHEPTRDQLEKNKLMETLRENSGIELLPLQSHLTFIQLISNADFVITDGGSIQEETYYLNKPCLIMRSRTERDEGLNKNAYLAMFDEKRIDQFLNNWQAYHLAEVDDLPSPSKDLVDVLVQSQRIPNP